MQKRILVFVPEFPVVTETFIARELSALEELKRFKITILALKHGRGQLPENLTEITRFHKLNIFDILMGIGLILVKPAKALKMFKTIGFTRVYLFFKILGYSIVFAKYRPDFIYSHFLSSPSTIALGVSIMLDVPLGISGHARDVLEFPDIPAKKVKLARFIAICNKNAMERVKGENVHLVYHGLNDQELLTAEKVSKPPIPEILSIGRYVEKKGLEYLIRAAKELKDSGREFTVNIIGVGPLTEKFKKLVEGLGLEKTVFLLGEFSFDEVRRYLHSASVYVQPAVDAPGGDSDGIPNTLIEAALVGVPIVATGAGSIRDFLDDNNAILVTQKNSEEIAAGIAKLMDDSELATRLVEAAKARAHEMFDEGRNIAQLAKLIESGLRI